MFFKSEIVFVVLLIGGVKSECDTYIECLGSFFDNVFTGGNDFNVSDTDRDVVVPEYENVNIQNDNLFTILSGLSGFLKEELSNGFQFSPPVNIFRNIHNDTAIYVKTLTITNDFDDIDLESIEDAAYNEFNLNETTLNLKTENEFQKVEIIKNNTKTKGSEIINKFNKKLHQNEILDTEFESYEDVNDNSTDYPIIDYLDLYKDTTNEYVEIETSTHDQNIKHIMYENDYNGTYIAENCTASANISQLIFSWVAAIFIKNNTNQQFDYYCDGAVVARNVIVTAARCLQYYGTWAQSEDILVLLGKTSLNTVNENEKAVKVKKIIKHENFTMVPDNDIAILITEDTTEIQPACLGHGDFDKAYTTGWAISGELTLIPFDEEKSSKCGTKDAAFCAVYDDDVTVCPSYGGLYVARRTDTQSWYLRGIRYADPRDRGFCVNHIITFTDLTNYSDWITENIE